MSQKMISEKEMINQLNKLQELAAISPADEYKLIAFAAQNNECLDQLIEDDNHEIWRQCNHNFFKDTAAYMVFRLLISWYGNRIKPSPERIITWIETKNPTSCEIDFTEITFYLKEIKFDKTEFERIYQKINLRNEKNVALSEIVNFLEMTSLEISNLDFASNSFFDGLEKTRATPRFKSIGIRDLLTDYVEKFPQLVSNTENLLGNFLNNKQDCIVQLLWPTSQKAETLSLYSIYQSLILEEREVSLIIANQKEMVEIQEVAFHSITLGNRKTAQEIKALVKPNCCYMPVTKIINFFLFELKVRNYKIMFNLKILFIKDLSLFDLDFSTENVNHFLINKLCEISNQLGLRIIILQPHQSFKNSTIKDGLNAVRNRNFESFELDLNEDSAVILNDSHMKIM
jgi:hypothetical protein